MGMTFDDLWGHAPMPPLRAGDLVRVVAGIRYDWLEQLERFEAFPYLPERECIVSATILKVHSRPTLKMRNRVSS